MFVAAMYPESTPTPIDSNTRNAIRRDRVAERFIAKIQVS
jgi:hypothetical protein